MSGPVFVTFWWGQKYGREYVHRLAEGIRRHMPRPYRLLIMTDNVAARGLDKSRCGEIPPADRDLLRSPGCFARLRLFDPAWQAAHKISPDRRIVCLDLDLIITGPIEPLFDRAAPFSILAGVNQSNPCPYNGSVWMLRAGYRADVWSDFTPAAAARVPFDSFPDDQGWLAHKIPGAATYGPPEGVYGFHKPGWPGGDALPAGARIVAFPGHRDPAQFTKLPWVRQHWLRDASA